MDEGGVVGMDQMLAAEVVKLERVVIVGKRADAPVVAQLPRVVIEGRRDTTTLAAAQTAVWIV